MGATSKTPRMLLGIIILSAIIVVAGNAPLQTYAGYHWYEVMGTSENELGLSITSDGNYLYIAGINTTTGSYDEDILLVKLDGYGKIIKSNSTGGGLEDIPYKVKYASGGYLLVAGTAASTDPAGDGYNVFIANISTDNLAMNWLFAIGDSTSKAEGRAFDVVYDGSHIYATGNFTYNTPFIMRLGTDGSLDWIYTLGDLSEGVGWSLVYSTNGLNTNLYVIGSAQIDRSNNELFIALVTDSYDTGVSLQWVKYLSHKGDTIPRSAVMSNGIIYIAGYTNAFSTLTATGSYDMFIAAFDTSSGQFDWFETIPSTSGNEYVYDMVKAGDGNLYVVGYNESSNDEIVAGFDTRGNVLWAKMIGGSGTDIGYGLTVGPGGYLYVTGNTTSYGAGGADVSVLLASSKLATLYFKDGTPVDVTDLSLSTSTQDVSRSWESISSDFTDESSKHHETGSFAVKVFTSDKSIAYDSNTPSPVPEGWLVSLAVLLALGAAAFFSRRS